MVITEVNTTSFNVEVLSSGLSTVRISWVALDGLPSQGEHYFCSCMALLEWIVPPYARTYVCHVRLVARTA